MGAHSTMVYLKGRCDVKEWGCVVFPYAPLVLDVVCWVSLMIYIQCFYLNNVPRNNFHNPIYKGANPSVKKCGSYLSIWAYQAFGVFYIVSWVIYCDGSIVRCRVFRAVCWCCYIINFAGGRRSYEFKIAI